jgi:hypothetical protein
MPSCCPNNHLYRKSWRFNYPQGCECHGHLHDDWGHFWLPNVYRKEKKIYRKPHYRQYKAKMKDLLRNGRYEDIRPYRKTGGWLTW